MESTLLNQSIFVIDGLASVTPRYFFFDCGVKSQPVFVTIIWAKVFSCCNLEFSLMARNSEKWRLNMNADTCHPGVVFILSPNVLRLVIRGSFNAA